MSLHEDFTGPPLAMGQAYGIRVWRVDKWGRLTGWTHKEVWTPGENVAKCLRAEASATGFYDGPTCTGVGPDCSCGFWAYHDGAADYGDESGVVGIIKGYGKTVVGERGFRCEKAEIVAVAFPKCPCNCLTCEPPHAQSRAAEMRVRRNYSDAAFFGSVDAMVEAFPPDPDLSVGPEADPEFWTRKENSLSDELQRAQQQLARMVRRHGLGGYVPPLGSTVTKPRRWRI